MCLSQLSFPHQGKPEPPPDTMTENGQTQTITAEQRVSLFLLDFFFYLRGQIPQLLQLPGRRLFVVREHTQQVYTDKSLIHSVHSAPCLLMSAVTH